MKKFVFKLATVLKVRLRLEEERKRELQAVERRYAEARHSVAQCQTELAEKLADYQGSMQKRFDRYQANDYYQHLRWLERQLQQAKQYLAQVEAEVAQAREALLFATRERKILDKLKEQAYQEYQAAEQKAENEFLDELGTNRFARKSSDKGG